MVLKIHANISTILEVTSEFLDKHNILENISEIFWPLQIFLDGEAQNSDLPQYIGGSRVILIDEPGITTTHVGINQRKN